MNFAAEEEKILKLWESLNAFQRSMELNKDKPEFTFYDGPPFATGLPHYGHILAGTIKDIVTRYASQTGHFVSRRAGWDCHGLPVEYEIDKKLDIKSRDQVMAMGIDKYNAECRSIVSRYSSEWESIIGRMGRWIDFKNDYKTLEPWYMESVWWVFQQLWEKKLVYKAYRVMPYSTACTTPLSNFEAGLNYKEDTQDPAVVVSFPVLSAPNAPALVGSSFIAWTTTPWTLPSNLALCVHPELDYVQIRDIKTGNNYVLAEARLTQLYSKYGKKDYKGGEFEVLNRFKGVELVSSTYEPLFPYFVEEYKSTAFRVVSDNYVTADAGTGIVHQAPAFGEDDYRVCSTNGVIDKTSGKLPCPIDPSARYTSEVPDFEGLFVKDADEPICAALKSRGRLIQKGSILHSYPFCWRSDTPLIYRAIPAWFVSVESIKDRLLERNTETYWVPSTIKEGRFHNWLRDARDWNVSRNRYWGTPLPVWGNEEGTEYRCFGSIKELEEACGQKVTDLHREFVDSLEVPSLMDPPRKLKRIDEVFDCWFESGSMPYAQLHYPFENKDRFERNFPADFIAEGLDQTRGWFYTLMVLSTALFDRPAFKNLIVNGLVLAEDGHKMSKRLKNYPDPMKVVHTYGADALRLYLINSPVVKAEPLRFKEAGVLAVVKDIFIPWVSASDFLIQNIERLTAKAEPEFRARTDVQVSPFRSSLSMAKHSQNPMDRWIMGSLNNLIAFVRREMAAYRLYTVVPRLVQFIDHLTNWFVRLNRRRFKGDYSSQDAYVALSVLHTVLLELSLVMAPFTPFLSESQYQKLRVFVDTSSVHAENVKPEQTIGFADSVHFIDIPQADASLIDEQMEAAVAALMQAVVLARNAREKRLLNLKTPVLSVYVVHPNKEVVALLETIKDYIKDEVNALEVHVSDDAKRWTSTVAEPNMAIVGKKYGKNAKGVVAAIKALTVEQIEGLQAAGSALLVADGNEIVISLEEVKILRMVKPEHQDRYEVLVEESNGQLIMALDSLQDDTTRGMGVAREFCNRVQRFRKNTGRCAATDQLFVFYQVSPLEPHNYINYLNSQNTDKEKAPSKKEKLTSFTLSNGVVLPVIPGQAVSSGETVEATIRELMKLPSSTSAQQKEVCAAAAAALAKTASEAQQQADWLYSALLTNLASSRAALRTSLLPSEPHVFCPLQAFGSGGVPVIGTVVEQIAGAYVTIQLVRAVPIIAPSKSSKENASDALDLALKAVTYMNPSTFADSDAVFNVNVSEKPIQLKRGVDFFVKLEELLANNGPDGKLAREILAKQVKGGEETVQKIVASI